MHVCMMGLTLLLCTHPIPFTSLARVYIVIGDKRCVLWAGFEPETLPRRPAQPPDQISPCLSLSQCPPHDPIA